MSAPYCQLIKSNSTDAILSQKGPLYKFHPTFEHNALYKVWT